MASIVWELHFNSMRIKFEEGEEESDPCCRIDFPVHSFSLLTYIEGSYRKGEEEVDGVTQTGRV